jgi:glycerophosphoryl diester phosphodiesterase
MGFIPRIFYWLRILKNLIQYFVMASLFISCAGEDSITFPTFTTNSLLTNSLPITEETKPAINGVYIVDEANDTFGKMVVLKWNGNTLSIFTGKNFAYFILKGGIKDSVIIFEGYWRFAQENNTGLSQLKIMPDEGARQLLRGDKNINNIVIRGSFGNGNNYTEKSIVLKYSRPLLERSSPFYVIAHRGGGRNLDQPPQSENSLGIIQLAESYGANAIEIDVRLTKDNIPIIYHDENISSRLVVGEFLVGPIKNYPYSHLLAYCKLKNGEPIPTLAKTLETVIHKTKLSLVWMDIKDSQSLPMVIQLQKEYSDLANSVNRNVELIIGLPDKETMNEFLKHTNPNNSPSLSEMDYNSVLNAGAVIWAPAWTRGPMTDQVNSMKKLGKRVFFWTVDAPEFIKVFLEEGAADGILTNYPSVVAYQYYVK